MAAKRSIAAFETQNDQLKGKRTRPTSSFASMMGEVKMAKSFESLCNCLEPLLRRVVKEEVEHGIQRSIIRSSSRTIIARSPSLRIQPAEQASLRLIFTNAILPTTFTCTTIYDNNNMPLQLMLVEQIGDQITPKILPYPIKIELVPVDGEFTPSAESDTWSATEFDRNVVKEREGKRPLLTKEVNYTMKNTSYLTVGEMEFTDNSSWLRCRKFKIGARVVTETSNGVRIVEALTEAFIVKDHRGVAYKKHHPPMLSDDVWRLEKIGKDGILHKRLADAGICTVQDYLKLSVIDSIKLKTIIGGKSGISERMWETILKHAKTCEVGNKLYISRGNNYTLILDSICQIINLDIAGQHSQHLTTSLKQEVDQVVKIAYENWNSLQEVNGPLDQILQLPQGCDNTPDMIPYEIVFDGIVEVSDPQVIDNNEQIHYADWGASPHLFD